MFITYDIFTEINHLGIDFFINFAARNKKKQ